MNPTEFRERIRASLANERLQMALDANAERRVSGRIAAFASLPDWRERRQQAHAIRAEVIEHLDEHLATFVRHAEQNGMTVHHAKDATEAIGIILEVVESNVFPGTARQGRCVQHPRVTRRWRKKETDDWPSTWMTRAPHLSAGVSRPTPILVAKSK